MARWLPALAILALPAVIAPAAADDSPWCTEFDPFTRNCSFATYNECAAVAKSVGATCVRNARYQPPAKSAPPKSAARKPR
jgi:hypothetical protein